ncbi:HAMP domain-containing sensor histidine kinase [Chryseobacterium sp. ISL-6]|uniref:sensor histidine kinase n=1 Tax=Chryseobacterium sp. ISL-6 TaxID=2819143 RepID=UPI001BEA1981|nr:HAMP domain-containing sensor histidine kinase [Chryseobacterium sp. ISL-6]MBT2619563.1 HAMP domain-containing histidine kinase [Chryseobacterium sp. ISL-6]
MKPLLSKTTKPFLIYVLIILIISIPVYYWVVDAIWKGELDEHNITIVEKTAFEFNHLNLSESELEKSVLLWNKIQPGTNIEQIPFNSLKKEQTFTVEKQKTFVDKPEIERYRCLKKVVYINHKPFLFTVETNIEESHETIAVIAAITVFFFMLIVLGLLFLNRKLSTSIWKPFRNTLEKLKTFNLNTQNKIEFDSTDIIEFEELNLSLKRLIEHNVSVYKTQKEFTENASHELQTPLAIIKNKLDILMQNEDLTEKQYQIAEEINRALTRSSRINKNLLLLAKIENLQFAENENLPLSELLHQSLEILKEHFDQKHIEIQAEIMDSVYATGNRTLTETLINNLLINVVRHTSTNGTSRIELSQQQMMISNSGSFSLNGDNLFKRFSKASTDHNGSGLGLAIVKEICTHQGWILDYYFKDNQHTFFIKF